MRLGFDGLAGAIARPLRVAAPLRPAPYIVVLSGGVRSTGKLNATTVARLRFGVRLFERGLAPAIVVSGGPRRPGRPAAAPHMQAMAEALGVPRESLIVEARSSRTSENAREVARLLRERGAASAILVTSAMHTRRAKLCFEAHGIEIVPAPVPPAPDESPVRASQVAQLLHEVLGLAYYRALGWI